MAQADRGPVIPGTSGLRKIRMASIDSNRGQRDSFRVCYALFPKYGISLLVTVYGKSEKANLSDADKVTD